MTSFQQGSHLFFAKKERAGLILLISCISLSILPSVDIKASKTLIIGAQGRVGSVLVKTFAGCMAWGRAEQDLMDVEQLERAILQAKPELVINCAAMSNLEDCLDDPVTAHYVNAMAPVAMARCCAREEVRFIHLSTDYVLDGRRAGLKSESDKCRSINTYGCSKEEAEWGILQEYPQALIARISWVFGNPSHPSFAESILHRAQAAASIAAISDKYSLPTYVGDLARWLKSLASNDKATGILHLCQSGDPMSWFDYAQCVLQEAYTLGLLDRIPPVSAQKMAEQSSFRDPRPIHTAMSTNRLSELLNEAIPSVQDAMNRYLATLPV